MKDPYSQQLKDEFQLRSVRWAIVLDGRGETLAAVAYTSPQPKAGSDGFDQMLRQFEAILARTESIQDILRTWDKTPADEKTIEKLSERYREMQQQGTRIAMLLESRLEAAEKSPTPDVALAIDLKRCTFLAWTSEAPAVQANPEIRDRILKMGISLIEERPQSDGRRISSSLFSALLMSYFDVPARTQVVIDHFRQKPEAAGLKPHADYLEELLVDWKYNNESTLKSFPKMDETERASISAMLGDAETTLKFFAQPRFAGDGKIQSWMKDAKAKQEKAPKK